MRRLIRLGIPLLSILMIALLSGCSSEQFIVLDPKGPVGAAQKDLIYLTSLLCLIVLVPVLAMTAIFVWRYRDKKNSKASYKPNWAHSTKLETIWWGIPIVIIAALAVITIQSSHSLEPSKPLVSEKEPITIQVTSLDWKWLFKYPDEGIATVNYLQIPEGVPVRFQITSDSNMNSFWIPQLGGQIYAMSGMAMTLYLQADEKGQYFGTGANFTGRDFAHMTFTVNTTSEEDYKAWVQQVKQTKPELTMEDYYKLAEKGTSGQQFFSKFPDGLFEKVVSQYTLDGAAHRHGGTDAESSKTSMNH